MLSGVHSISSGPNTAFGEDLFLGAIGQVVKNGYGRNFLVERVMEALGVYGCNIFAIFRSGPVANPIGVVGEASDFLIFYVDFEEAHGWFVVRIVHYFGVILLFLLRLLVGAGIFFGAEDDGVFVQPGQLVRRTD